MSKKLKLRMKIELKIVLPPEEFEAMEEELRELTGIQHCDEAAETLGKDEFKSYIEEAIRRAEERRKRKKKKPAEEEKRKEKVSAYA